MAEKDIKQNELGSQKRDTTSYKLITEMATFHYQLIKRQFRALHFIYMHMQQENSRRKYMSNLNLNKENQYLFYVLQFLYKLPETATCNLSQYTVNKLG